MKKKTKSVKPTLIFTPEIRAFFREREIARIQRYKDEIKELKQSNANWKWQHESIRDRYYKLRNELKKLIE